MNSLLGIPNKIFDSQEANHHSVDPFEEEERDEGSRYLAGQEADRAFFLQLVAFDRCQLVGVPDLQILEDRSEQVWTQHQALLVELQTRAQLEVPDLELGRGLRVEDILDDPDPPVLEKIAVFLAEVTPFGTFVGQLEPRDLVLRLFGIDERAIEGNLLRGVVADVLEGGLVNEVDRNVTFVVGVEDQSLQEEQHLFLPLAEDALGVVLELEDRLHLGLVEEVVVGEDEVVVLGGLDDVPVQVAQVARHVVEVDDQLEVRLDEEDEQLQKFLDLPARLLIHLRPFVYLGEVDCDKGFVPFLVHRLGGELGSLHELPHLVIEVFDVPGLDRQDDEVVESMLEEVERLLAEDAVLGVEDDEMVVLGKLDLDLVLLFEDGNVFLERGLNDRPHGKDFCTTEALMQEVDDGDVKLSELLDGSDHLCYSQIGAEEDAGMEAILCLEPHVHVEFAELLAEAEGDAEEQDQVGLVREEKLQTVVHIEQPVLADDVQFAMFPHEDVEPWPIGGNSDLVFVFHLLQFLLVNLHKDMPSYGLIMAQLHDELARIL